VSSQEKFLTIRSWLCGINSSGVLASDDLVDFLRAMFSLCQMPFEQVIRQEGARYSFINYNFIFRRFFDLAGVSEHFSRDFPPLKSKKKREDIILHWFKILSHTGWPYLNSDGDLFGPEYHTDVGALRQRRRAAAARADQRVAVATSATDANLRSDKLRGGDDAAPRAPLDCAVRQQAMSDFLDALRSANDRRVRGAEHDDCARVFEPGV
jgi:hypothetical protein